MIEDLKVDSEDRFLIDCSWYVNWRGYVWRLAGYDSDGKPTYELLHRLITKCPDELVVDHINGDKLDNRKSNLRCVTQQQNISNRPFLNRNNKSGFRGVSLHKVTGKWRAVARVSRRQHHLGLYGTPEEANLAVQTWRMENMPGSLG